MNKEGYNMWNINIRKGTIWSIKSLNEYDDYYEGMKYGSYKVLILSAYTTFLFIFFIGVLCFCLISCIKPPPFLLISCYDK